MLPELRGEGGEAMSDESLWALWIGYKALFTVVAVAFVALIIAEIVNLYR